MLNHIDRSQGNAALGIATSIFVGFSDIFGNDILNNVIGNLATSAATGLAIAHYSKEMEAEADYLGIYLVALSGAEYKNSASVWHRMLIISDEGHNDLFSSHPSSAKRFVLINKTIDEINNTKNRGKRIFVKWKPGYSWNDQMDKQDSYF